MLHWKNVEKYAKFRVSNFLIFEVYLNTKWMWCNVQVISSFTIASLVYLISDQCKLLMLITINNY